MRKCFELIDGNHSKFWTVETSGKFYFATFGRIGTHGQTQTKQFHNHGSALQGADAMIRAKLRKGYVEVDSNRHPGASRSLLASLGETTATAQQVQPVPQATPKVPKQAAPQPSTVTVPIGSGRRIVPLEN